MIMSVGSYVRRGQRLIRRWTSHPRFQRIGRSVGYFLLGFLFSAASLGNAPQPLPLSLLCAGIAGWPALFTGLGSCIGYGVFWGNAGAQGLVWTAAGLVISLMLGGKKISRHMPLLMPALAGLSVAASGLMFLMLRADSAGIWIYLLRIGLVMGAARVFSVTLQRRDPVMDWLACGLAVLALAQVAPIPTVGLGYIAAAALAASAPLPAAALAGLALDLSRISPVPMTAVLCLAFLVRLVPGLPKWSAYTAPAAIYVLVALLCGVHEWDPALPLVIGGFLGILLPPQTSLAHRRGETGMAQVRLELAASALAQTEQLLLEVIEPPIDEAAIISKVASRACGTCPCRTTCHEREAADRLPTALLHRPLVNAEDIPLSCRKSGRLLLELRRGQDHFRTVRADRDRQREYRSAVVQQYRFLCEYLQELSDQLPRRQRPVNANYRPEVSVRSAGLEATNGDQCLWFAGTQCRYYILLCDGMGTGEGAAQEGRIASELLKRLLQAGYPAEYALRNLNSLCVLRSRAGAVTVDLAEIDLSSGKAALYKWGAAPSYLLTGAGAEKIGTAAPPPGLSVTEVRETVDRLSLRRGETLLLLSDGVDGEAAMRRAMELTGQTPGELAPKVLQYGRGNGCDDATVAAIRLYPSALST